MAYKVCSRRRFVMSGFVSGALASTADGQIHFQIPFDSGYIVGCVWGLDVGGTTSGGTNIMLTRVRAESDSDLLSAADTIAHDASTLYSEIDTSTLQNNSLVKGDIVRVDLDAVTGGTDSAGLSVSVIFHVLEE